MNTSLKRACRWALSGTLALAPLFAGAAPVTILDPFGAAATSCASASCDVIGDKALFDIDRAVFDFGASSSTIDLYLNFQNPSLSPFVNSGITLDVGDLLFAAGGHFRYGVALRTHGGSTNGGPAGTTVLAGHLYELPQGDGNTMTARQALNNPSGVVYRPDQPVWLWNQGNLLDRATGTVTTSVFGDGTTRGRYDVRINFSSLPSNFLNDLAASGLDASLAVATCGNDVLSGHLQTRLQTTGNPVSAPAPLLLMGAGIAVMGWTRRRR